MGIKFIDDELIIGGGDWELAPFKFSKILKIGGGGSSPTYEDIVISGNGSVTLANAKADGLNYVKLFGGCEQPQPDKPNLLTDLKGATSSSTGGTTITIDNSNAITLNGKKTSDSSSYYSVTGNSALILPAGTYTLSAYDIPENASGTKIRVYNGTSPAVNAEIDLGSDNPTTTFTLTQEKYCVFQVYVKTSFTYDNFIIKPMLVTGSTAPLTYTPALPCMANPVAIKCNNGEIKMVDDELPEGYKRVLGYTCNNDTLWQITDFHLRGSDTVRISFSVTAACNVFGCYQGADTNNNYDLYVSTTSGSKYLRYGNGTYLSYWSSSNLGQRFDIVFTPTGTTGMPQDSTWSPMTFESANDLLLAATTLTGTSSKLKGDLYGNFVVDGRLKLIPCERVSDGSLGYYDTYSETFFEPTGTPTSLGYDGSHYVLTVDGTVETVEVTGKNLNGGGALDNKGYTSTGGTSTSTTFCGTLWKIKVKEGEKYTVSCGNFPDGISGVFVNTWKTDGTFNLRQAISMSTYYTFTIPAGIGEVNFTLYKTGGITIASNSWLQVEKGETATTYEPYYNGGSATATNLLGLDTIKDVQNITTGEITRNVGVYVFDGSETFSTFTASDLKGVKLTSATTKWGAKASVVPLCTHFKARSYSDGSNTSKSGFNVCYLDSSGNFFMYTADNNTTNFKTWLQNQYEAGTPLMVAYAKTTATTESVTPQTLTTKAGTNIIGITASINNLPLEVSYKGIQEQGE